METKIDILSSAGSNYSIQENSKETNSAETTTLFQPDSLSTIEVINSSHIQLGKYLNFRFKIYPTTKLNT